MAVRNGPGTGSLVIRYAGWMFKDNHNLFSSRDAVSFLIEVKIGPRKELNPYSFQFLCWCERSPWHKNTDCLEVLVISLNSWGCRKQNCFIFCLWFCLSLIIWCNKNPMLEYLIYMIRLLKYILYLRRSLLIVHSFVVIHLALKKKKFVCASARNWALLELILVHSWLDFVFEIFILFFNLFDCLTKM